MYYVLPIHSHLIRLETKSFSIITLGVRSLFCDKSKNQQILFSNTISLYSMQLLHPVPF